MKSIKTLTAFLILTFTAQVYATEVFVALNKLNTSPITEKAISKILKAEKLTWEDGNSVVLFIDSLETTESKAFADVTDMSKSQFIEYWRIKFFSGRALIPKQVKNNSNSLSILSENKNGIYIHIGESLNKELTDNPNLRIVNLKF